MPNNVEELALRWRKNPDPQATIALCDVVRGPLHQTLMLEVGDLARDKHSSNVNVLIAVARMYTTAQKLAEAQSLLVAAGKIAPRDGAIYRALGEVLLRRGDADRAEKVFERAMQFGANDSNVQIWLERSRSFKAMQSSGGSRAVASEIERLIPADLSIRPPADSLSDEADTSVRKPAPDVQIVLAAAAAASPAPPGHPERSEGPPKSPVMPPAAPRIPPPVPSSQKTLAGPIVPAGLATAAPAPSTGQNMAPMFGFESAASPQVHPGAPLFNADESVTATLPRHPSLQVSAPAAGPGTTEESVRFDLAAIPPAPPSSSPHQRRNEDRPPIPIDLPPPPPPSSAARFDVREPPPSNGAVNGPPPVIASTNTGPRIPSANEVLSSLALAGVFEPPTGQAPAVQWDKPTTRTRRRSSIVLVAITVLFAGGVFGFFHFVRQKRQEKHMVAENVLSKIDADLHAAKPESIPAIERDFKAAFELDSRSPRAALAWLHERALVGLLKGGRDLAFEEGTRRAHEVGLKDEDIAFAQLASFLFQGDTVGAAALLPRFDGPAANDAWYQLMAGATLERAGDSRALERYAASVKLDPELIPAQTSLVRLLAIDSDPSKAATLAKQFRAKYPDRAEGAALAALAWARDPARSEQPPADVKEMLDRAGELPLSLSVVPNAVRALQALDKRATEDAKAEVKKGLSAADSPGMAVWLGSIAISTDDEQLARKAALVAVSFSAVYPPARILAARVALLGDRLDEALKATEDLEAGSPDVAIVRAAAAYERVDADGLARALEAIAPETRKISVMLPVVIAQEALAGRARFSKEKILALATNEAPWADLVAMDIALDYGDLETAKKIAASWKDSEKLPLRAARLSRLARYDGRLDDAEAMSLASIGSGTVTPRTLQERALVLVARGKATEVGPVLAKYPLVLGALSSWLAAYALASAGKIDEARGRTAAIDPPPPLAPLPARMIAAMALGAMKDKHRGFEYVKPIYDLGFGNPDMANAGAPWGLHAPGAHK
jgi:predicted Zn-dependent protease